MFYYPFQSVFFFVRRLALIIHRLASAADNPPICPEVYTASRFTITCHSQSATRFEIFRGDAAGIPEMETRKVSSSIGCLLPASSYPVGSSLAALTNIAVQESY